MLPVTNSLRMSVCRYDGEHDTFEFKPVSMLKGASEVCIYD